MKSIMLLLAFSVPIFTLSMTITSNLGGDDSIQVFSNDFQRNQPIPLRHIHHYCNGQNISPHLKWTNIPQNIRSFVIILVDPDAPSGDFVHWILYDIPVSIRELQEGFKPNR